jgi:hypothetical protein
MSKSLKVVFTISLHNHIFENTMLSPKMQHFTQRFWGKRLVLIHAHDAQYDLKTCSF